MKMRLLAFVMWLIIFLFIGMILGHSYAERKVKPYPSDYICRKPPLPGNKLVCRILNGKEFCEEYPIKYYGEA